MVLVDSFAGAMHLPKQAGPLCEWTLTFLNMTFLHTFVHDFLTNGVTVNINVSSSTMPVYAPELTASDTVVVDIHPLPLKGAEKDIGLYALAQKA